MSGPDWLNKLRPLFRGRIHYHVTRAGYLFASALVIVGAAAVASANNLLFLILAAMLASALISGVVSRLCLAGLELELVLPEHIAARQPVTARFKLRNLKWFPSFALHLSSREEPRVLDRTIIFSSLPARATAQADAPAAFPNRGLHRESLFVLATRFPFGLVERRVFIAIRSEVVVYPSLEPTSSSEPLLTELRGELEREQRGMGSDFYRLRPYELYENARYVDWRSSARTGELQVREFASEERSTVYVYFDLRGMPGEGFENAVESCAFLVWTLSGESVRVRFRTQQTDLMTPDEVDIYRILRELALVQADPNAPAPLEELNPDVVLSSTAGAVIQTLSASSDKIVSKPPH
jgi:uncharacterized protein (DUF58 family)